MRLIVFLLVLFMNLTVWAEEYNVAVSGKESGDGSMENPFRRIQAAADIAQPGDVITVHEGMYRERLNPLRGGESDSKRIVYRAAPGETVEIRGSERIRNWKKVTNDTWRVTLPNNYFGDFNPYNDIVIGEWYGRTQEGFDRHTGAVYLNGTWLDEAQTLDEVLKPVGSCSKLITLKRSGEQGIKPEQVGEGPLWIAEVDDAQTTIWAQFKGVNPNEEMVEINVRQCVFYPKEQGRNYITVRGFIMRHAATPWSGQMSEQIGLIGTHWSKGWIIEDNIISHSINTGLTLGCYNPDGVHKTPVVTSPGYVQFIKLAEANTNWNRDNIGSHIVRNNHISHCEKNAIHGSLGGVFSIIEGNTICEIAQRGWLGIDVSGLKLLGAQDCIIRNNHIYHCRGYAAIWLDWMAQGARITGNLLHDNVRDLFVEISHGPNMVDNNIFLSKISLLESSGGGAYAHNLFAGTVRFRQEKKRKAIYHEPHSLKSIGETLVIGDDERYYHNLFCDRGLSTYGELTDNLTAVGNVYTGTSKPSEKDRDSLVAAGFNPNIKLEQTSEGWWLTMSVDPGWLSQKKRSIVTSKELGRAKVPDQPFKHPDGSSFKLDVDYFGKVRSKSNPSPGPFEFEKSKTIKVKVWPKI